MKKTIAFILALTMILALCACGSGEQSKSGTEKRDEYNDPPTDESEGQDVSDKEILAGLWTGIPDTDGDFDQINFLFFSTDGYIYFKYYSTEEAYLDCAKHFVDCVMNDSSSSSIEKIYEFDNQYYQGSCSIQELYEDNESSEFIFKYDVKDGMVIITDSRGNNLPCEYCINSVDSTYGLTFTIDNNTKYFEKCDSDLDDTYRYFTGNWNVERNELVVDRYGACTMHDDSFAVSFTEDYRANDTDGNTYTWNYANGIMEIDGEELGVIKLSQSVFIMYFRDDWYVDGYCLHDGFCWEIFNRA